LVFVAGVISALGYAVGMIYEGRKSRVREGRSVSCTWFCSWSDFCTWFMHVIFFQQMRYSVSNVSIGGGDSSQNCTNGDQLTITDNTTQVICGSTAIPMKQSSSSTLEFEFTSNSDDVTGTGFILQVEAAYKGR
jgi:hypothetical protein